MFLTPDELFELTHCKRAHYQVIVLNKLGISSRRRPDGTLVVLRTAVEQAFGLVGDKVKRREVELGEVN